MLETLLRWWRRCLAIAVLLPALNGCVPVQPPQSVPLPAPVPGMARLWFYRQLLPGDTMDAPAVALNGKTVGWAPPGRSFYRDVPAGTYLITVQSYGRDANQSQDLAVAPGQEQYAEIQSLPSWIDENRGRFARGTYYVRVMPPPTALLAMSHTTYWSGTWGSGG
jgi:hypothetical protein